MGVRNLEKYLFVLILIFLTHAVFGQGSVPVGINYQAVARDNSGKELASKNIDVKFSILSGNPLGTLVYQELHSNIITSKFGVFSLIIGKGVPTGGTFSDLSQVNWSQALHYLKVEVKFDNVFVEMGTMQFLSVPYALYAQKSLEPGPQGPKGDQGVQGISGVQGQKGDPGDPASDNQTLSFDGSNLSISVGNAGTVSTVNLTSLNVPRVLSINGDTVSITGGSKITLPNEIQDLSIDINNNLKLSKSSAVPIDLTRFLDDKQQLSFNNADSTLSITNGTNPPIDLSIFNQSLSFNTTTNILSISGNSIPVDLTVLRNDPDSDPTNEIQDLYLNTLTNRLTITNKISPTEINLTPYLDNKDEQTLSYDPASYSLTISKSGSTAVIGSLIAFRAKKTISVSATALSDVTFTPEAVPTSDEYNDGNAFNRTTGEFVAPTTGIYTFSISYYADGSGGGRKLIIYYNTGVYEEIAVEIAAGTLITRSITMKLNSTDIVRLKVNTGFSTQTGTGTFSGYRVY